MECGTRERERMSRRKNSVQRRERERNGIAKNRVNEVVEIIRKNNCQITRQKVCIRKVEERKKENICLRKSKRRNKTRNLSIVNRFNEKK